MKTPTIANGPALNNRLANIGGILDGLFESPYWFRIHWELKHVWKSPTWNWPVDDPRK